MRKKTGGGEEEREMRTSIPYRRLKQVKIRIRKTGTQSTPGDVQAGEKDVKCKWEGMQTYICRTKEDDEAKCKDIIEVFFGDGYI